MKTKKQKNSSSKETPLLVDKGYSKIENEIMPVEQDEAYQKPTKTNVKEAVKELNPTEDSLGSRG